MVIIVSMSDDSELNNWTCSCAWSISLPNLYVWECEVKCCIVLQYIHDQVNTKVKSSKKNNVVLISFIIHHELSLVGD